MHYINQLLAESMIHQGPVAARRANLAWARSDNQSTNVRWRCFDLLDRLVIKMMVLRCMRPMRTHIESLHHSGRPPFWMLSRSNLIGNPPPSPESAKSKRCWSWSKTIIGLNCLSAWMRNVRYCDTPFKTCLHGDPRSTRWNIGLTPFVVFCIGVERYVVQ
jgi:hypothetical protein